MSKMNYIFRRTDAAGKVVTLTICETRSGRDRLTRDTCLGELMGEPDTVCPELESLRRTGSFNLCGEHMEWIDAVVNFSSK